MFITTKAHDEIVKGWQDNAVAWKAVAEDYKAMVVKLQATIERLTTPVSAAFPDVLDQPKSVQQGDVATVQALRKDGV